MAAARASSEGSGRLPARPVGFLRRPRPELDGDVDERAHVVVRRAEVDEARPQPDLPSTVAGGDPDAAVVLQRAHERALCSSGRRAGRHVAERDDRERRLPQSGSSRRAARRGRRAAAPARTLLSTASRNAWAPCARNASQSLSARNGREYSSVMSTVLLVRASCGMYDSSCENASKRSSRRRTSRTPQAFGRKSHLCASSVTESARSRPAKRWAGRRGGRRGQPVGAVDVEPDALLGAHVREPVDRVDGPGQRRTGGGDDGDGTRPAARSARIASATASGGRRRSPSIGSERTFSEPSPRISAARSIE